MPELFAAVAIADISYWVDRPYDYRVPEEMAGTIRIGMRVRVPFSRSNRKAEGLVLRLSDHSDCEKLKSITEILDTKPVLSEKRVQLALWMRERWFCTVYEAARTQLPAGLWLKRDGGRRVGDKTQKALRLLVSPEEAFQAAEEKRDRAPKQSAVLSLLSYAGEVTQEDVISITGASESVIRALVSAGLAERIQREIYRRPSYRRGEQKPLPVLTEEQNRVYASLAALLDSGKAASALLFGVTGSGKTAVYIHLIRRTLDAGKGAVLMVPEISLTHQMLETFSSYFGENIAVLHSSLTASERYDEWKRVRRGEAKVVIGARSAVFAPVENPGLMIIDEEQEETYKSENTPRYHTRDIAKYLCAAENALLLLGSATPDFESRYAAETGRCTFCRLTSRYNRRALPEVRIVDMKGEMRRGNFTSLSYPLREEIAKNLKTGEQSILFLNRRGTSKLITCTLCGKIFQCPNCTVSLTYHAVERRLMCHYCGYARDVPELCPDCGGTLSFVGDGTQKVQEQLREIFPQVQTLRMDTDTVARAGSHDVLLRRFQTENIPILIGTQMVSKGLNLENVTLVGVLSADQSLYSGDFRSGERTFSRITQVIGRGGRASRPGRAVVQTFTPDNPVIRMAAAQDYERFYSEEMKLRKMQYCPPFSQMLTVSAIGTEESAVLSGCAAVRTILERQLSGEENLVILGPAPYPVVKVSRRFRYKITLLCQADRKIRELVGKLLIYCNTNKQFRGVSFYADINPVE